MKNVDIDMAPCRIHFRLSSSKNGKGKVTLIRIAAPFRILDQLVNTCKNRREKTKQTQKIKMSQVIAVFIVAICFAVSSETSASSGYSRAVVEVRNESFIDSDKHALLMFYI